MKGWELNNFVVYLKVMFATFLMTSKHLIIWKFEIISRTKRALGVKKKHFFLFNKDSLLNKQNKLVKM